MVTFINGFDVVIYRRIDIVTSKAFGRGGD
jgi:hypothetical protein